MNSFVNKISNRAITPPDNQYLSLPLLRHQFNLSKYSNRPSNVTPDEALEYVRDSGASKGTYWSSGEQNLREFFQEECGYLSNLDEMMETINSRSISAWWYAPGFLSTVNEYKFFYVENNEF